MPTGAAPGSAIAGPGTLRRIAHSQGLVALRSFAVFTLLWYGFSVWNASPLQLPSPLRVVNALSNLVGSGEVLEHALISTSRLVVALVVATLLAVPLGFLMGLSVRAHA